MIAKNYIKLPKLECLKVINYPLFDYGTEDHWMFQMKDGINIMLGANSIGKTTTVNMIKFAFVGSHDEIDANYFSERLKKYQKSTPNQHVVLHFILNGKSVEIHRNLMNGLLDKFVVASKDIPTSEYTNFMQENSHITLDKLTKLLELILIRVEEGNYILWDKNAQTEIMSILLNDVEFQEQFFQDEARYKTIEDTLKNVENLLKNQRTREQDLRVAIKSSQNKQDTAVNIEDMEKQLEFYNSEKLNINALITNTQNKLNKENINAKLLDQDFEEKKMSLLFVQEQIQNIEFEIKIIKSKLLDTNISCDCILCSTTIGRQKAEMIYKQYFFEKICPVCNSSIGEKIEPEDIQVIKGNLEVKEKKLERLKLELTEAKIKYDNAVQKRNDNEKLLNDLRVSLEEKNKELYELSVKILDLQKDIDLLRQKNPKQPTSHDVSLIRVTAEIKVLEEEYSKKKNERNLLRIEISNQRKQRNKILTNFYEKLNIIFKNYSKEYFVQECELTFYPVSNSSITQLRNFAPILDEIPRLNVKSVSHSQLVFLEYLFRVSLLELYFEETGAKPFLFLETSEGVFDVANTEAAAQLFAKFALHKFPVVIVCNLSKQDEFIDVIFKNEVEKQTRLFNLIKYGKLTIRQKQNKQLKIYFDDKN